MKVKKSPKKHTAPPPDAAKLIEQISKASEDDLPDVLQHFRIWRYSRGDLHGWVPVLDHFDTILEGIVNSYDLTKNQLNDFTPKTKELLLEILRIYKLLLENCTSRKLFSSYDRLNDLLLSNDLDVLLSVISVLQRQAATYGSQIPIDHAVFRQLRTRLAMFARGSESLRSHGFSLKTLASSTLPSIPDDIGQFSVSFYQTQTEGDSAPKSGPSSLAFDAASSTVHDDIAEAAENNHMSVEDQLEAHVKARWIESLRDGESRQKLLAIRLTALAALWFLSQDDPSAYMSNYEPDLVSQIVDLFNAGIPEVVQTAALTAIDGCARTRTKMAEVMTVVGANLSHGALMSVLRRVVGQLLADEPVSHDVVDATLTLVATVVMSLAPTQGLPTVGLIPVLLDLLRVRCERRDTYIPRATGLMDALGTNSPQSTADGITTLVARAKDEIELLLAMQQPEASETMSEETITAYITNPLRAILRSLHRVQAHGAEGSRTLLDSELPSCLKRIYANRDKLGSKVFVQSINIMASFIHNEPTSLSILQEQSLPQSLFSVLGKDVPDAFEVMIASCSAIGASCLNSAGLDYAKAHPELLVNIIDGAITCPIDNTSGRRLEIGGCLDELARHHPSLRPTMFNTIIDRLKTAIENGKTYVPEDQKEYSFDNVEQPKPVTNEPLTKLNNILQLLDGLVRNSSMCDDFIKEGLSLLSQIPALPCLPVAYTGTDAHGSLSKVYQTIGHHDHVKLVQHMVAGIKSDLEKTQPLWKSDDWTDAVQVLPGMAHRLVYLGDMLTTSSFGHQRVASSLHKVLSHGTFMADLGALHRASFRRHAKIATPPETPAGAVADAAGLDETPAKKQTAADFLATRMHTMCTKLYRGIIRSLFNKRANDSSFKKESAALGKQIALDLIKHLQTSDGPACDKVAVGLICLLLFDERGADGRLSTIVFVPFYHAGGVKALLESCSRLIDCVDQLPPPDPPAKEPKPAESEQETTDTSGDKTTEGSQMDVDQSQAVPEPSPAEKKAIEERAKTRAGAITGARVALILLGSLVSTHSLVDAPQSQAVQIDENWKPHEVLIRLRLQILPLLHRVWTAEWLPAASSPAVLKACAKAYLAALSTNGETEKQPTVTGSGNSLLDVVAPVVAQAAIRAPIVADPARVDQLVDMGFSRGSAELALVRARNNVAAATELILMMPHLFEGDNAPAGGAGGDDDHEEEEMDEERPPGEVAEAQAAAAEAAEAAEGQAAEGEAPANVDDVANDGARAPPPSEATNIEAAVPSSDAAAPGTAPGSDSGATVNTDETTDADTMQVDAVGPSPLEQLNELRKTYKETVADRALVLVDNAEDLVFDVMSAFPTGLPGAKLLMDHTLEAVNGDSEKRVDLLAARLRLTAVFLRHNGEVALDEDAQLKVCSIVSPLQLFLAPHPRWVCALMLFAEAAFASSETLAVTKIGDAAVPPIDEPETLDMAVAYLSIIIHSILDAVQSTRDELISALRLLVVMTRRRKDMISPETIRYLIRPFKRPEGKLSGCQPYIAMILRHAFEDRETRVSTMRREIRHYLGKHKITDINHFARQVKHIAARDPGAFVEAVKLECALNDPSPAQSVYHIRALNEIERTAAPAAPADPFSDSQDDQFAAPIMDTLIEELAIAVHDPNDITYGGLIVSLLTEILGSYVAPKRVFLSSLRRKGLSRVSQPGKNGLATIVNDIICKITLNDLETIHDPKNPTESSKRLMMSSWATSMLVGLSCDPGGDLKEDAEVLTSVRKTLLDVVAKALKDQTANLDPGARYGRFFALAELVHGFLLVKSMNMSAGPTSKQDTASVQVAKIMLEKSFVGLITAVTGEVDLNYPGVKVVLTSLLRALDHLTKVAIKWSKNDKDKKNDTDEELDVTDEDVEMDTDFDEEEEPEHEAPDLYRNSALGMHMMDEDSEGEDDEEDEDEDMIEGYEEEMDDGMEEDESGTEPSSDDDGEDDEDPEDWTDDDMDPDEDDEIDEGPEVVIGDADPIDDDEWDDEDGGEGRPGDILDEFLHAEEDEFDDEEDMDDEAMMDEMDDLDDMDEMDEEAFDEMVMDHAEGHGAHYEPADPGYWGWGATGDAAAPPPRHRMGPSGGRFGGYAPPPLPRAGPSDAPAVPGLLAQPNAAEPSSYRNRLGGRQAEELFSQLENVGGPHAVRMLESLIARSERAGGHEPIRISLAQAGDGVIDVNIGGRSFPIHARPQAPPEPTATDIAMELGPKPSIQRWNEELKLAPIGTKELLSRVVVHMINHLLPAAKKRQEEAEEKRKKEEEEEKAKQEEADKKREEQKKKDEEEKAKRQAEEDAKPKEEVVPATDEATSAPAAQASSSNAAAEPASEAQPRYPGDVFAEDEVMEDTVMRDAADIINQALGSLVVPPPIAEQPQPEASGSGTSAPDVAAPVEAPAAAAPTLARTVVQIRGRDVDITDAGIDLEFLQALPEDMRAEVVEQHMREQNSVRQPPVPALPLGDDISAEFLDALPAELREEVIAAQAAEALRRQRNAGDAAGAPAPEGARPRGPRPGAEAILPRVAGMLGGVAGVPARDDLDMPQPPFFDEMPEEMREMMMGGASAAEIRGLLRNVQGLRRRLVDKAEEPKRQAARESIQLLEKPGIAALTRLLFFPETFKKDRLFRILANLCENSTTRSDLLNLLLSVLQDGSGELPMVDKSFQQMSIKNMSTPKSTLKTKTPGTAGTDVQTPGPTGAGSSSQGWNATNLFSHLQTENIPTFIAQRCIEALTHILGTNTQAVNFFLTEHEQGVGLRKVGGKKGKGKEKEKVLPQIKYPIVILLGLLERTTLLGTQAVMESLTGLLFTVTKGLPSIKAEIEKAEKDKAKEAANKDNSGAQPQGGDVAMADATTTVTAASASATSATPGPATATAQTPAPPKKDDAEATKSLVLTRFPVIPPAALRLVVNALTIGECSSRNFSQTLGVLQHLSCIPDAQSILLQELQERSQSLGTELLDELHALAYNLKDAFFETSNPTLTVFSAPSATQAQLLRLLKTIEYIHMKKDDTDPPGEEMTPEEAAVSTIYQSFDFDPVWAELRKCLTAVEHREDTKQIALILLPIVEALMVVCKYRRGTRLRDARSPSAGTGPMSPMSPKSPSASVGDKYEGDLFLSFTTHHRKVLNEIVRSSPALLSGSFSLLIHNPRVLEFDNKRQWFFQKLKKKKNHVHGGTLSIQVRRQYVFQDSFDALRYSTGEEIKYGKIGVKFKGEDGIDAGGVTREWYSVLAKQIFDPNFALFEPCAADQQTYQPNKNSSVNGEHKAYFKFIGRIIGKAVYDGRLLDAYFNRAFYKQILGRTVDMRDLESIDPEYHKSLQWMLENDITGVIDQEFTIEDEQFGEKKIVELKEGGAEIPVTEENKEEYVRLVVSYRLDNSIKDQIKAFLDGFYEIIPRNLIQIFEPDQLELLISGMSTIDVDELRNATQMSGWKSSDPEINWFWRALRSFSQEERSRFLMFVTSSSRVPLGGFTQLVGASGIQPFQIQKLYAKEGSLPQASTCFNLLLLPTYSSYEHLKERLQFAVTETGGFGKA